MTAQYTPTEAQQMPEASLTEYTAIHREAMQIMALIDAHRWPESISDMAIELLADVERHMAAERTRLAAIAHAEKAEDRRREAREDAVEEARLIRKGGEWL